MGSPRRFSSDLGTPLIRASADSEHQNADGGNVSVLNSWKEIARYLGRATRTVQRWERDLGLPVHRPRGQDRGPVLALSSELQQWLRQTPVRPPSEGDEHDGAVRENRHERREDISAVAAEAALPRDGRRRYVILSVDDEAGLLFTREKILECEGCEVLSAADGATALELLAARAVDLVLLDFSMPGMDGGMVAREMKRRSPLLPIIMVSGIRVPDETLAIVDCLVPKGEGPELLLAKTRQRLAIPSEIRKAGPSVKLEPQSERRIHATAVAIPHPGRRSR